MGRAVRARRYGLVYVPNFTNRQVVVVDLDSMVETERVTVRGNDEWFEVALRDGRVWVNHPYGTLLTFDERGNPRVLDDDEPAPAPETEPTASPEPTPEPSPSPPDTGQPVPPPPVEEEPEPVTVPDVVGIDRLAACELLQAEDLNCAFQERDGSTGTAGLVTETDPPAGDTVPPDTEITIDYFSGENEVGSYVGKHVFAACAEVESGSAEHGIAGAGFRCNPVGGNAGTQCGHVYAQEPPPGTKQTIATPVKLTFHQCLELPSYVGADAATACAQINAAGFQCNRSTIYTTSTTR